jgi:hypothetical protein
MSDYGPVFSACISCGMVTSLWAMLLNASKTFYASIATDALWFMSVGLGIYLLYFFYRFLSPWTLFEAAREKEKISDIIAKTVFVAPLLAGNAANFTFLYSLMFEGPLSIILKPAQAVLALPRGGGALAAAAQKSCQLTNDVALTIGCISHSLEVSMLWVVALLWNNVKTLDFTSVSFWMCVYLGFQAVGTLKGVVRNVFKTTFIMGATLLTLPLSAALWVIPGLTAAGPMAISVAFGAGAEFMGLALVCIYAPTFADFLVNNTIAYQVYDIFGFGHNIEQIISNGDSIQTMLKYSRDGRLSYTPIDTLFWRILFYLATFDFMFEEVTRFGSFWRGVISPRQ